MATMQCPYDEIQTTEDRCFVCNRPTTPCRAAWSVGTDGYADSETGDWMQHPMRISASDIAHLTARNQDREPRGLVALDEALHAIMEPVRVPDVPPFSQMMEAISPEVTEAEYQALVGYFTDALHRPEREESQRLWAADMARLRQQLIQDLAVSPIVHYPHNIITGTTS